MKTWTSVLSATFLLVGAVSIGGDHARAQPKDGKLPALQSRLKVNALTYAGGSLFEIELAFANQANKEQTLSSSEYRIAILNNNGEQVGDGPLFPTAQIRSIVLKGDSTTDKTTVFRPEGRNQLKSGEEYFLVVSVRNLTAQLKFTAK